MIQIDLRNLTLWVNDVYKPLLNNKDRYLLLYGGAGCLPGDTEFLTPKGWKRLDEYKEGDKVCQYDPKTNQATFTTPIRYIKAEATHWIRMNNSRLDIIATPDHRHLLFNKLTSKYEVKTTNDILNMKRSQRNRYYIPSNFIYDGKGLDLSENMMRLLVAIISDGSFSGFKLDNNNIPVANIVYTLKKKRKIKRLINLLESLGIKYQHVKRFFKNGEYKYDEIKFKLKNKYLTKDKTFGKEWYYISYQQAKIIADEVLLWDGHINKLKDIRIFYTSKKNEADFIQFVFTIMGYRTHFYIDKREGRHIYHLHITRRANYNIGNSEVNRVGVPYRNQYCFEVPTSFFIIRRNGRIYITGNSGKSVFAAQKVLYRIMSTHHTRILVVRKVARTIRNSVFTLFKEIISDWGLREFFKIRESNMTIDFTPNYSGIVFSGLDDPEKIKSIAKIHSIWVEEATELALKDFRQLNLRLRGNSFRYKQIIMTFNPIANSWIKGEFFDKFKTNTTILKTTYKDNKFIDKEYIYELESLKDIDEYYYRVYCLGEWGELGNLVFNNFKITNRRYIPPLEDFKSLRFGVDFGFNNPSAVLLVGLYGNNLYVIDEIYRRGLTNANLIEVIKERFDYILKKFGNITYYCDSAEPDRIKEFRQHGLNAKPVSKIKNGINVSIDKLKSFDSIIISDKCVNTIKEIKTYKWQESNGEVLDKPVAVNDHAMDALRYSIMDLIRGNKVGILVR